MSGHPSFHGKMECDGLSHAGAVRTVNADQFMIADLKRTMLVHRTTLAAPDESRVDGAIQGQLLLVADGIGQDTQAAHASNSVVEAVANYLLADLQLPDGKVASIEDRVREQLGGAFVASQQMLEKEVNADPQHREMVATLTMGLIVWPKFYVAHVGNSRCYLYSQRRLKQLTTDHTLAQRSVQQKLMDPDKLRESRWNNVLWNAIGTGFTAMQPESVSAELSMGDALLLCTDGVTRHLGDRQLADILKKDRTARETCQMIVDAAIEAGGDDNATVVVARFRSNERLAQLMSQQAESALEEPLPTRHSFPDSLDDPEADTVAAPAESDD